MKDFIKRNVKFVVTIGVSFLIIAGLTTALIVTNVGGGGRDRNRDRDRSRDSIRMELTEEQIAERTENARERLEQRLAEGRITQEEFNERSAAIESGEYPAFERNRSRDHRRDRDRDGTRSSNRSERGMTDEMKADKAERSDKDGFDKVELDMPEEENADTTTG